MILPVPHQTRRAGDSGPRLVVRVSFDGERKVPTEGRKDVESLVQAAGRVWGWPVSPVSGTSLDQPYLDSSLDLKPPCVSKAQAYEPTTFGRAMLRAMKRGNQWLFNASLKSDGIFSGL